MSNAYVPEMGTDTIFKCIAATLVSVAILVSHAAAVTPKIERLERESRDIEVRIQKNTKKYCRYTLDTSRVDFSQQVFQQDIKLSVFHGRGPGKVAPAAIACPDIGAKNKNDWFALIAKQRQLYKRIEEFLRTSPELNKSLKQKLRAQQIRIGTRMTCDFVRLIHGNSFEAMEIARSVLQSAQISALESRGMFSPEQLKFLLFRKIYSEMVDPGPCAPPQCLPNEIGAAIDISLSSSKQVCEAEQKLILSEPFEGEAESAPTKERGRHMEIPDDVWQAMQGKSWHAKLKCPARDKLRLLEIPYIDFNSKRQTGRMIVAGDVADDILQVFSALYKRKFQIERMELAHTYGGNDSASMKHNNTSAFNCRKATTSGRLSEHAKGYAVDINPVQNPYVRRGKVIPSAGHAYKKPSQRRWQAKRKRKRGVIYTRGPIVKEFAKIGWKWGGRWRSLKEYKHFSKSGR